MLNRKQYLLTKLAEEANEVAQIALRSQQFQLESIYGLYSNKQRCHLELNNLFAVIQMLNTEFGFGFEIDANQIVKKIGRVNEYYDHSVTCGCVEGKH